MHAIRNQDEQLIKNVMKLHLFITCALTNLLSINKTAHTSLLEVCLIIEDSDLYTVINILF